MEAQLPVVEGDRRQEAVVDQLLEAAVRQSWALAAAAAAAEALREHPRQLVLVAEGEEAVVRKATRCSVPGVEVRWVSRWLPEQGCQARTPCQRRTLGEGAPWYQTG